MPEHHPVLYLLRPDEERYTKDIAVNNQSSILDDLKTLIANKDWRILFALNVVNLIAVLFKGGTTLYYVNNIMGRADLGSLLLTTTTASGVLGAMLSPFIFKNIDKVRGFKISMAIEAALLIGMYFVPAGNVAAIFALVIIINIIQLAATPLQWSMLSDIIDAEEKRSGKSSAGSFFNKPVCHQAGDRHRRRAGGLYAGMGRLRWRRSAANRLRAADDQAAVHRLPRRAGGAAGGHHEQVQHGR